MKKLFLILLVSFFTKNITAQDCCPYLNTVKLSPTPSTTVDSIYLITHVSTPNQGTFIGYTITETDTLTTIEACYYIGLATVITEFRDTLNLGVRPSGTFKIKFIGHLSNNMNSCSSTQSQSTETSIEVDNTSSVFSPKRNAVTVFPNPIENNQLTISTKIDIEHIQIFNQLGVLVFDQANTPNHLINIDINHLASGIYFLKLKDEDNSVFSHKIIKK